jgi:hypothetical protein
LFLHSSHPATSPPTVVPSFLSSCLLSTYCCSFNPLFLPAHRPSTHRHSLSLCSFQCSAQKANPRIVQTLARKNYLVCSNQLPYLSHNSTRNPFNRTNGLTHKDTCMYIPITLYDGTIFYPFHHVS